jgi:hypothetical protein
MPGRPLKNYDYYKDKLEQYAAACEITVERKSYAGDGAYMPSQRKVVLDVDLPESTEIATFLHELGHSMDDTLLSKSYEKKLSRAYRAVYEKLPTQSQLQEVIECERRAWIFGRALAKKLRIPLGKWYESEEADALGLYRSVETQDR